MTSLVRSLMILIYSLLTTICRPLVRILAFLSPKLKDQLAGRESVAALARRLAPLRASKQRSVLFFCSSAGEYEQARPLIERLEARPSTFVHVIFFSKSGLDFFQARREKVSACLAPLGDSIWEWGWLMSALRPDLTVVVRHELWPAFLETARSYGQLQLIAASQSQGESQSRFKRFARTELLTAFDLIHAVSDGDAEFFHATYGVPRARLRVSGDPKYDRVIERARAKTADAAKLKEMLDRLSLGRRRLILGSAHRPDVEACLAARAKLGAGADPWQIIIAPHDISPPMIEWIHAACRDSKVRAISYSSLTTTGPTNLTDQTWPVIVLDTMGMLADVYGAGDAAFVGGALHHQVHNVLEPACHGLALGYGPFYKNSQEAVRLVQGGLATIIGDANQFAAWWQGLGQGLEERSTATKRAVAELAGATDRILLSWQTVLEFPAERT